MPKRECKRKRHNKFKHESLRVAKTRRQAKMEERKENGAVQFSRKTTFCELERKPQRWADLDVNSCFVWFQSRLLGELSFQLSSRSAKIPIAFNSTDLERWLWFVVIHFDPLHFHDFAFFLLTCCFALANSFCFHFALLFFLVWCRSFCYWLFHAIEAEVCEEFNLSAPKSELYGFRFYFTDSYRTHSHAKRFFYASTGKQSKRSFRVPESCWLNNSCLPNRKVSRNSRKTSPPRDVRYQLHVDCVIFLARHW